MTLRMPVLRGDDEIEMLLQFVDDGHDTVAFADGERAAGTEIVLDVNEDERAARLRLRFGQIEHRLFLQFVCDDHAHAPSFVAPSPFNKRTGCPTASRPVRMTRA